MPATVAGNLETPVVQIEQQFETDRFGVDILTLVEEIPDGMFPSALRAQGGVHPRYSSMAVARRSSARTHAGQYWRTSYIYEGFLNSLPEPTYDLSGSLEQVPIALHPNFADFAGTPSAPLNGAIFLDPATNQPTADDEIGVFREFGPNESQLMGVEAFLDPGATWTKTSFSTSRPNLRSLGRIDAPDGPNPTLSGRNWLMWETSFRKRGFIYELRETWKLSGRGGWNPLIY